MCAKVSDPAELWAGPATEAFKVWISLWPVAPLFGVEWRFAGAIANANPLPIIDTESALSHDENEFIDDSVDEAGTAVITGKPASLLAEAPADADDLTLIKGIGPGTAKQLNALGVYKFAQIAGFTTAELTWVDDHLKTLKGRCFRDDWTGQAKAQLG